MMSCLFQKRLSGSILLEFLGILVLFTAFLLVLEVLNQWIDSGKLLYEEVISDREHIAFDRQIQVFKE